MILKFEHIRQLGVLPGRVRKRINNDVIEEVSAKVVEASSGSLHRSVSALTIMSPIPLYYISCAELLISIRVKFKRFRNWNDTIHIHAKNSGYNFLQE